MKRFILILLLAAFGTSGLLLVNSRVYAASPIGCPQGPQGPVSTSTNYNCPEGGAVINGVYTPNGNISRNTPTPTHSPTPSPVPTSEPSCGSVKTSIDYGCAHNTDATGGPIYGFIRAIIKFASGLVGIGVLLMLIIGGIRYTTSAGNPKLVASAKNQIINAVVGLALFGLMLAILNFLLPGGIIK